MRLTCGLSHGSSASSSSSSCLVTTRVVPDMPAPATEATATKEELLEYFRMMYTVRRVEIASDVEYKVFPKRQRVMIVFHLPPRGVQQLLHDNDA